MNKRKVVGYALIVIPIVAGIAAGIIFFGTDFLEATAITAGFLLPILVGCHLLAKS